MSAIVSQWTDRVTKRAAVSPHALLENPHNWRLHTPEQARATEESIARLGYLKPVIVREGTNTIIDGHLRVQVAIQNQQETVPVDYVELSDDDERLALAALDRITVMAETDSAAYMALLEHIPRTADIADLYGALIAPRAGQNEIPEKLSHEFDANGEWVGMPEYIGASPSGACKRVTMLFETPADVQAFSALIDQDIPLHTTLTALWYPAKARQSASFVYRDEPDGA